MGVMAVLLGMGPKGMPCPPYKEVLAGQGGVRLIEKREKKVLISKGMRNLVPTSKKRKG